MFRSSQPLAAQSGWPSFDGETRTLRERYILFMPREPDPRPRLSRNPALRAESKKKAKLQMNTAVEKLLRTGRALGRSDAGTSDAGSRAPGTDSSRQAPKRADNWRETIESIVVAFVLAFLFRTFEAEAFVIPTGSMAPTLYGQH